MSQAGSKARTSPAFQAFRSFIGEARLPPDRLIASPDQCQQMSQADGLEELHDGPVENSATTSAAARGTVVLGQIAQAARRLWVVAEDEVLHAEEMCGFGKSLQSGVIKHTNLTGGAPAYSGGEMVMLDEKTMVINGQSGRYGPRSERELDAAAKAFRQSGYHVWCMGYDNEAGYPLPFGVMPRWVV